MDGYAVRALDTVGASAEQSAVLAVIGMHAAGDAAPLTIREGEAAAIATGAPLPAGADAAVRREETDGVAHASERTSAQAILLNGCDENR